MQIRRYTPDDATALFALMEREGEEWSDYYAKGRARYTDALGRSITYVACDSAGIWGYARCRDDDGFGLYVYDLLVDRTCRGQDIGRRLTEQACADYPEGIVYVMSDVDTYYEKQGYVREGSIFIVKPRPQ